MMESSCCMTQLYDIILFLHSSPSFDFLLDLSIDIGLHFKIKYLRLVKFIAIFHFLCCFYFTTKIIKCTEYIWSTCIYAVFIISHFFWRWPFLNKMKILMCSKNIFKNVSWNRYLALFKSWAFRNDAICPIQVLDCSIQQNSQYYVFLWSPQIPFPLNIVVWLGLCHVFTEKIKSQYIFLSLLWICITLCNKFWSQAAYPFTVAG